MASGVREKRSVDSEKEEFPVPSSLEDGLGIEIGTGSKTAFKKSSTSIIDSTMRSVQSLNEQVDMDNLTQRYSSIMAMTYKPKSRTDEPISHKEYATEQILEDILQSLSVNFNMDNVTAHLTSLIKMLEEGNHFRRALEERLEKAYLDVNQLEKRHINDPRVLKLLKQAEMWREEKMETSSHLEETKIALKAMKSAYASLESQFFRSSVNLKKATTKSESAVACERHRDDLEDQVASRDKTIDNLHGELEELLEFMDEEANKFKVEIRRLKDKILHMPSEKDKMIQHLNKEVALLHKIKQKNTAIIRETKEQAQRMTNQACKDREITNSVVKTLESLRSQYKELRGKNQLLERSNEKLKEENKKAFVSMKKDKWNMLLQLRQQKASDKKFTQLKRDLIVLQKDITHRDMTIDRCHKEINKLLAMIEDKTCDIGALEKNKLNLESQVEHASHLEKNCERQLQLGLKKNKEILHFVDKVSQESNKQTVVISNLQNSLTERDTKIERLNEEISDCRREYQIEKDKSSRMKTATLDLRNELLAKETEIQGLVVDIKTLRKLLDTSNSALHNLKIHRIAFNTEEAMKTDQIALLKQMLLFTKSEKDLIIGDYRAAEEQVIVLRVSNQKKIIEVMNKINESNILRKTIKDLTDKVSNREMMIKRLEDSLQQLERENIDLTKEKLKIFNQRDLFGMMVIRGKTELKLIQEKVKLCERLGQNTSKVCNERTRDCQILIHEIKSLRKKLNVYANTDFRLEELSKAHVNASREHVLTEAKLKRLSDYTETRPSYSRFLKVSQPSKYELLQKVKALQKQVIDKSTSLTQKNEEIFEKEKEICQLNVILGRRDLANKADSIHKKDVQLRQKSKKMKGLIAELNMLTSNVHGKEAEVKILMNELAVSRGETLALKKELTKIKSRDTHTRISPPRRARTAPCRPVKEEGSVGRLKPLFR